MRLHSFLVPDEYSYEMEICKDAHSKDANIKRSKNDIARIYI